MLLNNFVVIADVNNAVDTTGYGLVTYQYFAGKYLITNGEYLEFLNTIDPNGSNTYGTYTSLMSTSPRGGITFVASAIEGSKYIIKTNMFNKPVNFLNWYNAARYCNWLHNGKPNTAAGNGVTETGAYSLTGNVGSPSRNISAAYFIPTEDEWYKSAYYKSNGQNTGYFLYATQNNIVPTSVCSNASGDGSPSCNPSPTPTV